MSEFQAKQHEPSTTQQRDHDPTHVAGATDPAHVDRMVATPLGRSPSVPDAPAFVHGFERWVPLIKQGDRGTINGVAAQVIAHILDTPMAGVFDWYAMTAEKPPWWSSLPRENTPVGPNTSAGTAILIDRALFLVTGYRTYSFYTIQQRDALSAWNAEAHRDAPDRKRLDELERPLRYIRFMQKTLDTLARQVFEESR